ncbi:MAG TPA: hypothetical protein ENK82_07425 [Campylobacterales bacterium]|nr:hypothetical protein [Campylobacterales bacterium]
MYLKMMMLLVTMLFVGCGETLEEHPVKSEVNSTVEKKEQAILKQMGIDIGHESFKIDLNKTTDFLKQVEIEMHGKADEIQHKIEKADINFTRDMGLVLTDDKVEVDLNKTKKMFQEINILIKEVLLDTNRSKN